MAHARFTIRSHWPEMMLMLLFIAPPRLGITSGQQYCNNSGQLCPYGYCCNVNNTCGNSTDDCGANCFSQCTAGFMRCGPQFSGTQQCPDGMCCSIYGWCGVGNAWCGIKNCSLQCPNSSCGANGGICRDGDCCNKAGYCGNSPGYCSAGSCVSQCPPPPAPSPSPNLSTGVDKRKSNVGTIVGISLGVSTFLIACIIIIALCGKLRRRNRGGDKLRWATLTEDEPPIQLEGMPERFSYSQLSNATGDFSKESKLGQGGFGSVHSGVLPSSGVPVAVKKINSDSNQGEKEFMAEVSIISQLRHRNLIQLQGWCKDASRGQFLLVYELMPNGSLDKVLFIPSDSKKVCLSWSQRFKIVTGTAAALDYLHQGWKQQVIHRDIKSSNIMVDGEWNAKLGDFGLARLVDHHLAAPTTGVQGTYGYIAPEAATTGRFTDKTDVYAFGAVVLEIACGRRAFSTDFPPEDIVLVDWVWRRLSVDDLLSTVDKRLEGNYDTDLMEVMLILGLLCSHPDPQARPSMQHVVEVLAGHVPVPSIPTSKPATVYTSDSQDFLIKSLRGPKSWSPARNNSTSKSWPTSLVSMTRSDSTAGSFMEFISTSSNSNSS